MQLNPREQMHLDNAVYFTAIRGRDPRVRIRQEFANYVDAVDWAKGTHSDGRTMIYAVSDRGSAHITNA